MGLRQTGGRIVSVQIASRINRKVRSGAAVKVR